MSAAPNWRGFWGESNSLEDSNLILKHLLQLYHTLIMICRHTKHQQSVKWLRFQWYLLIVSLVISCKEWPFHMSSLHRGDILQRIGHMLSFLDLQHLRVSIFSSRLIWRNPLLLRETWLSTWDEPRIYKITFCVWGKLEWQKSTDTLNNAMKKKDIVFIISFALSVLSNLPRRLNVHGVYLNLDGNTNTT